MEPLVDTVVLAAVRRGHRQTAQIAQASPLPGLKIFASLRRLERDGMLVCRRHLYRVTAAGEEALRIRRLEVR
jgi:DNA-binding PadR family transcriptional regulator